MTQANHLSTLEQIHLAMGNPGTKEMADQLDYLVTVLGERVGLDYLIAMSGEFRDAAWRIAKRLESA